ncbi:MAG: TolB family protein, partial [Actinomycetota bacterium]
MRRWVAPVVLVMCAVLAACSASGSAGLETEPSSTDTPTPSPSPSPTPVEAGPLTGRIAFASDRDGDYEIYVMNADGSNLEKLTDNSLDDLSPSWSPEGNRIVFE